MTHKILVADDEPKLLRVIAQYLSRRHCHVATALNGEEALQKITGDRPDLIIADIGMPGMDGYELCSRLRRDATTRTIPFIFLTGRDQETDRMKARKIGADDYLTKPCPLHRLAQSVEAALDRIEQARRIPLDQIGVSGRIEDVDLLDMIQAIELEQKTGALVLSHEERTGTIYFRDGAIVEADLHSPKGEDPFFRLLGWKTGRFVFIPDAAPERTPITASMANLLFQDLHALEEHEHHMMGQSITRNEPAGHGAPEATPARQVLASLDDVARRVRVRRAPATGSLVLRILVVGVARSGKSELIQHLVNDLSGSRWAALGVEEPQPRHRTDVGRVRVSPETALHLIAIRVEKRFWSLWEQCLPGAIGAIALVDRHNEEAENHLRAFLTARNELSPGLVVHVLVTDRGDTEKDRHPDAAKARVATILDLRASDVSSGQVQDQAVRLTVVSRLLEQWLTAHQDGCLNGS